MKKTTKDNKGITIITLIITIMLISILVSVATYSGINTYRSMKVSKFVAQMQLIQAKVDDLVETNKTLNLGENINAHQKNVLNIARDKGEVKGSNEDYRYFSTANLKNELDIDDIEDEVLINFKTREIVSINGVEYNENTYYTQYKLPNGQTIVDFTENNRGLNFEYKLEFDELNCILQIEGINIENGSLSFTETDSTGIASNWQTITNYTEKEKTYTANISKSGIYLIRLKDNTNTTNFITEEILITLTNKPKINTEISYNYDLSDSKKWAYAKDTNEITYVWIPRFAYKTDETTNITDIKFIKGNSIIATDDTYISNTWTIHNKFTSQDGIELTGIWISIDSAYQSGLDMIDLLNDISRTTLAEIQL